MDKAVEEDLVTKAFEFRNIDKDCVESLKDLKSNKYLELLPEFTRLKREIKLELSKIDVAKINNRAAREILQKVDQDGFFGTDVLFHFSGGKGYTSDSIADEIDDAEMWKLGEELFYAWYSHTDYIKSFLSISSLILGVSIPDDLVKFVKEARSCFAFQNYLAVYSLCRTILEVSMRDICLRRKFIPAHELKVVGFEEKPVKISRLINKVTRGNHELKAKIQDLYWGKTSILIHGHKTISAEESKVTLIDTLLTVQELYSHNKLH